ncbi:MAG: 30S ribosomal protein S27e [Candidatus Micrarchaeia archaeon]
MSKFLKVKCNECGNEQNIFGNSTNTVNCLVCGVVLAKPSGSRTKLIAAKVVKVLS